MIRGDEKYVTFEATPERRTEKAVLISTDECEGWVPRSCLHFMSDKAVDDAALGDELELRVMEWVAEERGFV